MSQPNNVWNRGGKQSSNTSRTPQNRSSTASPIQPTQTQATKQESNSNSRSQTPANNAWQAPRSAVAGSNGPNTPEQTHTPANGFNSQEVKQFLSRGQVPASYKPQASSESAPWASAVQPHLMSTGQAFFPNLNKQVAAFENGG